MKTLIIAGGSAINPKIIRELIKEVDFIIAADGGALYLYNENIFPDILVGDFDTLEKDILEYYKQNGINIKTFPEKKDKTDLELSIDCALNNGATEVIITCAIGTRMDHSIANILLLYSLLEKGIKAKIIDDHNEIFFVRQKHEIKKNRYEYISVIPIFDDVIGVTMKGFEYETTEEKFNKLSTYGISNKLKHKTGVIEIKKGSPLIILSKD